MKRFILTAAVIVSLCSNAAPSGWLNDASRAKAFSHSRNLPILVLFSGGDWSASSVEYLEKLDNSSEISGFIRQNCVPLYVELPPASDWNRDFRNRLQAEYPFIKVADGIPLPSIYFVDREFRNLNIREPHFSIGGFKRSIKQAQSALASRRPAAAEIQDAAESVASNETVSAPKTAARKNYNETVKTDRSDNSKKGTYTTSAQLKEAQRQRKLPRDYKGEPPPGWFTDPVKAREFAAARRLPIVILFSGTDWCGPCKALHSRVLKNRKVQSMITSECVGLYVNVPAGKWEEPRRKYPFWKSRGVPSMVITDSGFNLLTNVRGQDQWSYNTLRKVIREAAKNLK